MEKPLADLIRPKSLDDVVGQKHLLGAGKPLRRIIDSGHIPNLIFYGPSGVGKTTLARIIAVYEIIWTAQVYIKTDGLIWPLFYTGAFYLIFSGLLTILFNFIEKKLSYFRS